MIEFRNFSLTYPTGSRPALREIDLVVPRGQICAVVGAEGAGKTTLAGVISGVVPHMTGGDPTGSARVGGRLLAKTQPSELVGEVGLVMQNPFNQLSGARFSLREELAFGLENLGVNRAEMIRRVEAVMADLGLTALASLSPYEISGGQQQLLAIGSALVMRPAVMVLDEPTSQLDAVGAGLVFDTLETLRARGVTVVLFEHRLERPARYADRVLVLGEGRIVADGPPTDVLTDPRLAEWGVAPLRYTTAARRAAERGLWEADRPLPVTLEAAADGFAAALKSARTAGGL
ncbi:energy-coupling factor ABC transporter ATP-binding protein [Streptomyces cahuitamycinicus]|uniref:ABC transporter ATP-binding protein n=1 Tax=Streptomyces cahuitamycinicus TaxID=2070367 RepID=A0A2N8TUN9_9ACTN|nr:ABC transporter ATP-binding protein [Streptomyces cahuitamycinicus]PNG22744.1 ABC transporter ATP-binding protein [Streptomyces cahuitamycinicus]